jgi:hypothetical protein
MLNLKKKTSKPAYSYDLYKDGITQSALANFLACPQKFKNYMVDGYSSERSTFAMDFGNIFHAALDKIYSDFDRIANSGRDTDDIIPIYLSPLLEADLEKLRKSRLISGELEQEMQENYALAEVVLRHYMRRWFKEDKKRDWISLEQKFNNAYEHPGEKYKINLKGKIDGVFNTGKAISLLETKTKGQINEKELMDLMAFDLQNFFYLLNAKLIYGKMPLNVLYNVVRRPMLRQGKAETHAAFCQRVDKDITERADWYFMRLPISITTSEFNQWQREFDMMLDRLVETYEKELYYKNSTACTGGKGTCQFLGVCSQNDFFGLKKRDVLFPELEV